MQQLFVTSKKDEPERYIPVSALIEWIKANAVFTISTQELLNESESVDKGRNETTQAVVEVSDIPGDKDAIILPTAKESGFKSTVKLCTDDTVRGRSLGVHNGKLRLWIEGKSPLWSEVFRTGLVKLAQSSTGSAYIQVCDDLDVSQVTRLVELLTRERFALKRDGLRLLKATVDRINKQTRLRAIAALKDAPTATDDPADNIPTNIE